ncbi:asparagine synthetase domain-containing protein 1 isoform X2 [Durio zibethinus]|uniref:Asparagine synthetase domain-containing protein 1 isoform X2 n=1 Tax=Durio zibethinus TaxID=66656 RepID=A0A6P6BI15_DURZI|nr:asparagine synthetase domain-containing protein 1 isoform X2 [Durio zibethinus]
MCGIALLASGIRIDLSSLHIDSISPSSKTHLGFSFNDLKAALQRRGPDSLGTKKLLLLHSNNSNSGNSWVSSVNEEAHVLENGSNLSESFAELVFLGATLQLRGVTPVIQPLVDSSGNILVYNGELFGGIEVGSDNNDTEILMQSLGKCCSQEHRTTYNFNGHGKGSVPDVLSVIKGPWAIIYWQESSKTLWFGRDAFGRRSLLVHWPTMEDPRFLLSSVSPTSSSLQDFEVENGTSGIKFWEELSCGIYTMSLDATKSDGKFLGEMQKHEWTNVMLKELIEWERVSIEPKPEELNFSRSKTLSAELDMTSASLVSVLAQNVLTALRESMMRRVSLHSIYQAVKFGARQKETVPVAVLFSGGLDSMILAALLDECLDPDYEIDLLNVSFDGESAPDRISAKAGIKELRRVAPLRRWRLVHIDADLSKLTWETKHVLSLINPADTYMDLNIGIALWLAARGEGWICEESSNRIDEDKHVNYTSRARILLVGSGADEQCAGYGRHRTKYKHESWLGLHEEMKLDMQRIWKRNLGRDDRCIADHGKEARFPFLDEDVIRTLLDIPLWEVADLDQPSGKGDKKILREVAQMLGLHDAAILPKRAIQFGSRIARESNRKNFGSNRAANQASAGSVVINVPSYFS